MDQRSHPTAPQDSVDPRTTPPYAAPYAAPYAGWPLAHAVGGGPQDAPPGWATVPEQAWRPAGPPATSETTPTPIPTSTSTEASPVVTRARRALARGQRVVSSWSPRRRMSALAAAAAATGAAGALLLVGAVHAVDEHGHGDQEHAAQTVSFQDGPGQQGGFGRH